MSLDRQNKLWLAQVKAADASFWSSKIPELPVALQNRVTRLRCIEDVTRSVAGALLARQALAFTLAMPSLTLRSFNYDKNGRPYLSISDAWKGDFNISHAGEWVACSICHSGRTGVDIEIISPMTPGLERHILTAKEQDDFARVSSTEREKRLYTYWTLKEAFLKARGVGLYEDPRSIAFQLPKAEDEPPTLINNDNHWRFCTLGFDNYVAAVCTEATAPAEKILRITETIQFLESNNPQDNLLTRTGVSELDMRCLAKPAYIAQ